MAVPKIYMKRDDCTGLAFGGNKTRQLEFTIAQGLVRGADVLIGGAGSQSNHSRQLAAAAAKLGVDCVLVLVKDHKSGSTQGNLLLDNLLGAYVDLIDVETQELLDDAKQALIEKFEREGRKPFVVMQAANRPFGAMGYALCMAEMMDQFDAIGETPTTVCRVFGQLYTARLDFWEDRFGSGCADCGREAHFVVL